jgi:hypothetical protein
MIYILSICSIIIAYTLYNLSLYLHIGFYYVVFFIVSGFLFNVFFKLRVQIVGKVTLIFIPLVFVFWVQSNYIIYILKNLSEFLTKFTLNFMFIYYLKDVLGEYL